jgi:TorA maturation chaperone TorD
LEAVYYTITGILLYLLADWILKWLEHRAGRVFEYRTLVFFGLLLTLALVVFAAIRQVLAAA